MKNALSISIPASPELLAVVRRAVERMAELCGLDEMTAADIKLAVDEACANTIKHACGGDAGKNMDLRLSFNNDEFRVVIDDDCEKTDPSVVKGRDLDDVRPGGLGVHFIRKAFDSVSFDEGKKAGNRLVLIKYLSDKGQTGNI